MEVTQLPDGRFKATDGMIVGTGKTPEEAISNFKDMVETFSGLQFVVQTTV